MNDPLYHKTLLRLAGHATGAGQLSPPRQRGAAFNPACGDKIQMDVQLDDGGHISALAHETEACILAQASAALLGQAARGHSQPQIEALRDQIKALLKQQTPLPPGPFSDYESFSGAANYASRHKCVLLPLDALLDALKAKPEL